MTSVASIFGHAERMKAVGVKEFEKVDWPNEDQLIGIEVEFEIPRGSSHRELSNVRGWTKHNDGSLQYGVEYVLTSPLSGDDLTRAIYSFFNAGFELARNTTSSTHIHIDMTEKETTLSSLQTLLSIVYVLEPAIFRIVDPSREWCGYTNPLESADVSVLASLMAGSRDRFSTGTGSMGSRYYGVNVQSLAKFGSLEFRYFPTATSSAELIDWVKLVQCIKLASLTLGESREVIETFFDANSYDKFLSDFFFDWKEKILEHVPYRRARKRAKLLSTKLNLTESQPMREVDARKVLGKDRFKKIKSLPSTDVLSSSARITRADNGVEGWNQDNVHLFHLGNGGGVPHYEEYIVGNDFFLISGDTVYIGYPSTSGGFRFAGLFDYERIRNANGHTIRASSLKKALSIARSGVIPARCTRIFEDSIHTMIELYNSGSVRLSMIEFDIPLTEIL